MSDFARFCPKCYTFFRDPDLYARHVETCGFAKDKKKESTAKETAVSRRQTAAKRETVAEEKRDDRPQTADGNREDVENPPASAAVCTLPSAVSQKPPKFKT
jgi:uncharacterized C2H2 Zn-finger protein